MGRAGREHSGPQGPLTPSPAHARPGPSAWPQGPPMGLPEHNCPRYLRYTETTPGGDTEPPLGEGSNTEHVMRPKAALSPQLYP